MAVQDVVQRVEHMDLIGEHYVHQQKQDIHLLDGIVEVVKLLQQQK